MAIIKTGLQAGAGLAIISAVSRAVEKRENRKIAAQDRQSQQQQQQVQQSQQQLQQQQPYMGYHQGRASPNPDGVASSGWDPQQRQGQGQLVLLQQQREGREGGAYYGNAGGYYPGPHQSQGIVPIGRDGPYQQQHQQQQLQAPGPVYYHPHPNQDEAPRGYYNAPSPRTSPNPYTPSTYQHQPQRQSITPPPPHQSHSKPSYDDDAAETGSRYGYSGKGEQVEGDLMGWGGNDEKGEKEERDGGEDVGPPAYEDHLHRGWSEAEGEGKGKGKGKGR